MKYNFAKIIIFICIIICAIIILRDKSSMKDGAKTGGGDNIINFDQALLVETEELFSSGYMPDYNDDDYNSELDREINGDKKGGAKDEEVLNVEKHLNLPKDKIDLKNCVKWMKYKTWNDLRKNVEAYHEYIRFRRFAIMKPYFIWDEVFKTLKKYMTMDRECFGVIGVRQDGTTLFVRHLAVSPNVVKINTQRNTTASVPGYLIDKYSVIPGVYFFHTHPIKEHIFQFPSSADIVSATNRSYNCYYAGDALISEFGAFVYGIDYLTYQNIRSSKEPLKALSNYKIDLAMSMEGTRSWISYSYEDIIALLQKSGMYFLAYTNSAYVRETRNNTIIQSLNSPSDMALISRLIAHDE